MVAKRLEPLMTTTLTLKNIPDEVYALLRAQANSNRRSLNSEAIVCLESVLRIGTPNIEERLTQIRALRASLGKTKFTASDTINSNARAARDRCRHQHHRLPADTRPLDRGG
jgi:plasmid stability protein